MRKYIIIGKYKYWNEILSSAPRPWTQVLIIGCYAGNRLIVAVQALIPGKKSSYYREVLDVVRRLVNPVQPVKLISDFEMSLLKAVRLVFPACHLTGCNFHFAQALYRKAKGMGIFKLFGEDEAGHRRSVYKTFRTQNAIERTNNGMESSHKYFAKDLNHHPSLSDYLAALLSDVDKQVDTARAVRLQHSRARLTRNVIKEQQVLTVLDAANFDTDEGLIDAVHLLGLVMQGFVDGLRVPNEDEEENETSEEE
ncbi:MULE transposase domain-containing protein [Ditylenchus destructor]|uniref:MULE transposase domain-containing protein n=1 Tax=Ditylenchus destructor TaxID=166010 RepID=A0AAD4R5V2_9BILA|nr:MULE transposase domain-containing protein [Ditylenchus destructor]